MNTPLISSELWRVLFIKGKYERYIPNLSRPYLPSLRYRHALVYGDMGIAMDTGFLGTASG